MISEEIQKKLDSDLLNVGIGWRPLVKAAYAVATLMNITITQVKEKFGLLRIYHKTQDEGHDKSFQMFLDTLEDISRELCEDCGAKDGVTLDHSPSNKWLRTLCPSCREKWDAKWAGLSTE